MTKSELTAIMTGGFATVAGGVMGYLCWNARKYSRYRWTPNGSINHECSSSTCDS